jgi:hypothetical protein
VLLRPDRNWAHRDAKTVLEISGGLADPQKGDVVEELQWSLDGKGISTDCRLAQQSDLNCSLPWQQRLEPLQ